MAGYAYLLPIISIAPPRGYRLHQAINLNRIANLLRHRPAEILIERTMLRDGETLAVRCDTLQFDGKVWNGDGTFDVAALDDDAWDIGVPVAYLETHIKLANGNSFTSQFAPPFYTVYAGPNVKTFFSDNALKYGNTVTMLQVQAFGSWVEGYPAATIDPSRDSTESVVLINPFVKPATVHVSIEGIERQRRIRVPALSGTRLDLHALFSLGDAPWHGQYFVSGRNRLVVLTAKHSIACPSDVTTVEHSDTYRGELTHEPVTVFLRRRIGDFLWGGKRR